MVEPNRMADLVGPFYDTDGVATLLGVAVDALPAARENGLLLGVQTSDGAWIYPVFQIIEGQVDPDLLPVLLVFRHSPHWSAAVWLCTPDEELDELTPVEWVRAGKDPEVVIRNARQTAYRWADPPRESLPLDRAATRQLDYIHTQRAKSPTTSEDVLDDLRWER